MSVRLLYFASLREHLGRGEERRELPEHVKTVGDVKAWLVGEGDRALSSTPGLRFAVNQEIAEAATPVRDGDEIAFFPPVTGG
jgi:molybdopterin synthase sulfur carrier subunit